VTDASAPLAGTIVERRFTGERAYFEVEGADGLTFEVLAPATRGAGGGCGEGVLAECSTGGARAQGHRGTGHRAQGTEAEAPMGTGCGVRLGGAFASAAVLAGCCRAAGSGWSSIRCSWWRPRRSGRTSVAVLRSPRNGRRCGGASGISVASVALGRRHRVPLAVLFGRYDFPGRRVLGALMALPAVLPPLVWRHRLPLPLRRERIRGAGGAGVFGLRDARGGLQGPGAILLVHAYSMYVYF